MRIHPERQPPGTPPGGGLILADEEVLPVLRPADSEIFRRKLEQTGGKGFEVPLRGIYANIAKRDERMI
jgi:hypothetical protein